MAFVAKRAHRQFLGLVLAVLGLILTAGTSGVNDWRLWYVDDLSVINSGVAWVGIWRACFYSHVLDTFEFCQSISITDSFIPPEIAAAQVLCMTAIPIGIAGNLIAGYAVRHVYFNINRGHIRWAFVLAGVLYLLTATCSLVPVFWNMNSVLENRTIDFPPEFHLPPAPYRQEVGMGIVMGICSSVLLIVSGLLLLSYRQPVKLQKPNAEACDTEEKAQSDTNMDAITETGEEGNENPAFQAEDKLS
ncbi:claudin-34 [Colossoma macropomum]|uniref:claudin-34 n=1 Tax=Colossoma macropomum TaxID=42526 RepID=UPI00186562B8|nr:claudin-34 [Colossoma macropomum]